MKSSKFSRRTFLAGSAAAALASALRPARAAQEPSTPVCLTDKLPGNNQLLYFTSSSLLADDKRIVYISDRTGHPNLFLLDIATGEGGQLTANQQGYLHSYVYFDGRQREGLGKASISLDPQREVVYFLQGHNLCAADMKGQIRKIVEIPADQVTAFTHVSADGKRICVPTTDARALEGPIKGSKPVHNIDKRVQDENLKSTLRVYDTQTGKTLLEEVVPKSWITHVQFSPTDPDMILYNHEWSADCGIRRMWLWDGKKHIRLRNADSGRSKDDWTCHEMWARDGKTIIYHGGYAKGPCYIGRAELEGLKLTEIPFPANYRKYGHFTVSNTGLLVSDGYYQAETDAGKGSGEWISLQKPDWTAGKLQWIPLCRHGSKWNGQDSHPHPIYNHRADAVYFTANPRGTRGVYRVDVPPGV